MKFGPVFQEMSFKDISYQELWRPFCSMSGTICAILVKDIIRNNSILDQWFKGSCLLKIFLIWSSGGPFVQRSGIICTISVEGIKRNNYVKLFEFGPVFQKMSFKDIPYLELWWPFCSVEQKHFFEILVEGIMRNNCMHLFLIWATHCGSGGDVV